MGSKGPLKIVTPAEWQKRTSLTFSKRSASTRRVDAAYAEWYANSTSPKKAAVLMDALDAYLKEKGNDWSKVERDKESGGLMRYIYELVVEGSGSRVTPRGMTKLQTYDIPHSRYGVLYLLGNIDINMSFLSVGLEGATAIGGAVASGFTTNTHHLNNAKLADRKVDIGQLKGISQGSLATGASVPLKIGTAATMSTGTKSPRSNNYYINTEPPRARPTPGFPLTLGAFEAVKEDPALFLNPFVLPSTVVMGTGALVIDGLNSLRILIQNAISDLFEWVKGKLLGDRAWAWDVSGAVVKGVIKLVVAKCLEAAAPLVGAAMDIGGGIMKTIRAAKDRIGVWLQRRKIVLNPGHPEQLANSIESEMSKGIFTGLWAILKGVASLALQSFLPGAGNLVASIVTGIEWMVKFLWRIWEQSKIHKFLAEARQVFAKERKLAELVTEYRGKGVGLQFEPNMDASRGGIIHDLAAFKEFYQKGCDASPLIPMLTLNSGICGSLMTLIKMFGDNSQHDVISQDTFDAGNEYFARLKQFGRTYLNSAGFQFTSASVPVQGLLNDAVNDHNRDVGKADKFLRFLSA